MLISGALDSEKLELSASKSIFEPTTVEQIRILFGQVLSTQQDFSNRLGHIFLLLQQQRYLTLVVPPILAFAKNT